ncbi:hypothetical protein [Acinetobacter baumannii]|uniref:hypothetical protein n=1 Tax=Acinetobacter baumannii TaxID=470 RepID=UPI003D2FBC79
MVYVALQVLLCPLNQVKFLSLIFFTLYYVIVPLRCFLVEIHDGLYGFRLGFGFVFPFWTLTPIFITNQKNKFYIYLCVLLCALEVIFWILFSKMSGSKFYKRPLSVAMFVSSLIFALTFPWYLSWLREIDIKKWVLPCFFKEDRFISMIYAELSGDFPLGDSRQPIYKSLRPFDLVS